MDSDREAEATVKCNSILHPLSSIEWIPINCTKLPKSCDKIQTVFIPQPEAEGTLYAAMSNGDLYFCTGPFHGSRITWKGPHNFPKKKKLLKYAIAEYHFDLAIVGGWCKETQCSLDEVWILRFKTPVLLPANMPTKRYSAVSVGSENYLSVAGGRNEINEFVTDVDVYNGMQWIKVKSLPKELRNLTSALHNGVWYLVEEVDQNGAGETYSASLEKLISLDAEWQMLDWCSTGEMLAGPVSFDGKLLIIKKKWHSGYGIHMLSPKTKSWVHIHEAPLKTTDEFQHASMISASQGQLMMITGDSAVHIATIRGTDFIKNEKFSLMSLMKLEHGYNVPVLTDLKGHILWELKETAVFDLKFDKVSGSDEPAVNVYMNSWLKDENAGCPPTWNNLLVLLRQLKLQEVAEGIIAVLSPNRRISLSDLCITADAGVEALLSIQSELASLCMSVPEESSHDLMERIQHHCHIIMWKKHKIKRKLEEVRQQLSEQQSRVRRLQACLTAIQAVVSVQEPGSSSTEGAGPSKKPRLDLDAIKAKIKSPEFKNQVKIDSVIKDQVSEVLRMIFRNKFQKKFQKMWADTEGVSFVDCLEKTQGMKFIGNQYQLVECGDEKKWDASLLTSILLCGGRNNIWGFSSTSIKALKELKTVRNETCHLSKAEISSKDFEDVSQKIIRAVDDLVYKLRESDRINEDIMKALQDPINFDEDVLYEVLSDFAMRLDDLEKKADKKDVHIYNKLIIYYS